MREREREGERREMREKQSVEKKEGGMRESKETGEKKKVLRRTTEQV